LINKYQYSQGSVSTRLRCGGLWSVDFTLTAECDCEGFLTISEYLMKLWQKLNDLLFVPPCMSYNILAIHLWSPSFILQLSRVSRSLTILFDVQHLCCAINFAFLSAFHISRIQHIALLCPHPLIPDLLSIYLMMSFILGWKLTSSISLFLLSLSLSLIWTDLTDYCPAG